jgi:sulfate transport system substrate-binding protein
MVAGDEAKRRLWRLISLAAVAGVVLAAVLIVSKNAVPEDGDRLLNVSYDPTRELYAALNPLFVAHYAERTGRHLTIVQSHGGSSRQARAVGGGELAADVVTLGLPSDVDSLRRRGLVADDWENRLPNHAQPYSSTIVFVVRQDNPRQIHDWPDLLRDGVEIVTPDPRSSGNGKLSALSAWGAVVSRGGGEAEARSFLQRFYAHVPVLDEGARASAMTFAVQEIGDVHLTWENEALREVAASGGKLQLVYPPVSILAEPSVAWVDANVARDGTALAARAYLQFLFSEEAQEAMARLGYRPSRPEAAQAAGVRFPPITLFPVTVVARDWRDADQKFFGEDGIITMILKPQRS